MVFGARGSTALAVGARQLGCAEAQLELMAARRMAGMGMDGECSKHTPLFMQASQWAADQPAP